MTVSLVALSARSECYSGTSKRGDIANLDRAAVLTVYLVKKGSKLKGDADHVRIKSFGGVNVVEKLSCNVSRTSCRASKAQLRLSRSDEHLEVSIKGDLVPVGLNDDPLASNVSVSEERAKPQSSNPIKLAEESIDVCFDAFFNGKGISYEEWTAAFKEPDTKLSKSDEKKPARKEMTTKVTNQDNSDVLESVAPNPDMIEPSVSSGLSESAD